MTHHLALLMTSVFYHLAAVDRLITAVSGHRVAVAAALFVVGLALWVFKSLSSGTRDSLHRLDLPEYAAYTRKITSWS